jgi:SAM-dependent methyltransferase
MSSGGSGNSPATYRAEYFEPLFAVEERHFWFRTRNRCIAAATRLIPGRESLRTVVEHGCGTGFVLAELARQFPSAKVIGTDLFAEGLEVARRRFKGTLIQTDVLDWESPEPIDLVGMFDVLEHLDDDVKVLRAVREQLQSRAHLLLTVPAHMKLWSEYDVVSGHRRRYSRSGLMHLLESNGFEVTFCTEFMSVLLPLMWFRRRVMGRRNLGRGTDAAQRAIKNELRIHPFMNGLLGWALRPEAGCIRQRWHLPFGTSILALARKTQSNVLK